MNEYINIEDKVISNYLEFKLDKDNNNFTKEELDKITELVIDLEESNINNIKLLTNISDLTIRNGFISNNDFKYILNLRNLSRICFENCEIENADLIAALDISLLELINCNLNNYNFINIMDKLCELTIINGNVSMERINKIKNLKYLQLSYSYINDNIILNNRNIEELYIDNTNISDLSFIKKLNKLKRLSIDNKQYLNNKDLIDSLKIDVYEENMILVSGDNNEL